MKLHPYIIQIHTIQTLLQNVQMVSHQSIVSLIHVRLPAVLTLKGPDVWLITVVGAMLDGTLMAGKSQNTVKVKHHFQLNVSITH